VSAIADLASRRWVEHLHRGHPRHEQAAARLHDVLVRAAVHELHRRRGQLGGLSGPEFDDVAQQCADDAMMKILARLDDFRGLSRFTTWAYKFVIFEVAGKVARHAWQRTCRSTCSRSSWARTETRSTRTCSMPGAGCAPAWLPQAIQ
jgi:RNA polymerase sigma-70 factor (ECF subfamily)